MFKLQYISVKKICILFLLLPLLLHSQNNKTDSLQSFLITATDTSRVNALNALAKAYQQLDIEKSFQYASEAKSTAEKIHYTKGKVIALCYIGVYYLYKGEDEKVNNFYKVLLRSVC